MAPSDPFKLYDDIYKILSISKQLEPMLKLQAQLDRIGSVTSMIEKTRAFDFERVLGSTFANHHLAALADVERGLLGKYSWASDFAKKYYETANVMSKLAVDNSAFDRGIAALNASTFGRLVEDAQKWERLTASISLPVLDEAAVGWTASVASLIDGSRAASTSEALSSRLFAPTSAFTSLARRTAKLIETAASEDARARLSSSLALVESQIVGHTEQLRAALQPGVEIHEDDFAVDAPLRLARREQREIIVAKVEDPTDLVALAAATPSANVHCLAREVLGLVHRCNSVARTLGGEDVFRPTNRLLQVFIELPWIDARDEARLGDLVDAMYFLVYEGAGKDRLRFMKASGGPLDDSDCETVFMVKHLRNKWLRHDPEHGDAKSIKKSYEQLRERLSKLGFDVPPRSPADYRRLQLRVLEEVRAFLERLLRGLVAAVTEP
jgi:hypothetical protein